MRKLICRNIVVLLLMTVILAGLIESSAITAAETSLPTPKISVKLLKNDTEVKVTISKNKKAEGYEIYCSGGSLNFNEYRYLEYNDIHEMVATIKKNGKKKRTITLRSLTPGTYFISVCAYRKNASGYNDYSEYCQKKVEIKGEVNGYKSEYDFSNVQKGETIKFGAYEQDGDFTNGLEPIEWIVLDKSDDKLFLLSKYVLHNLPYNKQNVKYTDWESCTLRKWLNEMFINSAFNSVEQDYINTTLVKNEKNAFYGTEGGNDTEDKIFILSQKEMINSEYGFSTDYRTCDIKRRSAPTGFAKHWGATGITGSVLEDGVYKELGGKDETADGDYSCHYWLRSPGSMNDSAAGVRADGHVSDCGCGLNGKATDYDSVWLNRGVRPAMYISIAP